ncbi:MAG: phage holin family protein [Candidatus Thorarchaeota archaeon]|nr:phage holin family protein [Candidatus Thorarchaeota archaeon]
MGSEAQAADMFKCSVCNGNVKTGPDDYVITCTYCGSTVTIEGKDIGDHLMESAVYPEVRIEKFRGFLDKNKGLNKGLVKGVHVVENRIIYVPVWTAKVKADTWYKGYKTVQVPVQKQETYRDSEGNTQTRTVTEYETGYVPVQDEIHTNTDEPMLARKGARFYGLEEYLEKIDLKRAESYDFSKIKDMEPIILNAEIGNEEYEKAIHGRVSDRHRSQASSGLAELFDCRTTTNILGTTYLQTPFSLIRYKFQGDLYKCALDGHTGKVVKGEIPITKGQRIIWTLFGLIGVILAGAGAEILGIGYVMEDAAAFLIGGGVAAVIGIIMAFFGFRVLLMTQREKKG